MKSMFFSEKLLKGIILFYIDSHNVNIALFANDLGQEILLDVTNLTIVNYIKRVGIGTG